MKFLTIALLCALASGTALASVLTNADVVKMSAAQLDESVIITAIENSDAKFDTSTAGLIDLANAKVSKTVISAMIRKVSMPAKEAGATGSAQAASAPADQANLMSPSDVFIIDGNETRPMRYINPQVRTAARGFGFGGFASYAVLYGSSGNRVGLN